MTRTWKALVIAAVSAGVAAAIGCAKTASQPVASADDLQRTSTRPPLYKWTSQPLPGNRSVDEMYCTPKGEVWLACENDFLHSPSGGPTWKTVGFDDKECFAAGSVADRTGYLYVGSSDGILRSIDGGGSWKPLNKGLPDVDGQPVLGRDGQLYVAMNKGVFRLDRTRLVWTKLTPIVPCKGHPRPKEMVVNSRGYIYAATRGKELFKFTPGSGKWTPIDTGTTYQTGYITIAIGANDRIYVGGEPTKPMEGRYVWTGQPFAIYSDDGTRWIGVRTSAQRIQCFQIVNGPDGAVLFATNSGVFCCAKGSDECFRIGPPDDELVQLGLSSMAFDSRSKRIYWSRRLSHVLWTGVPVDDPRKT